MLSPRRLTWTDPYRVLGSPSRRSAAMSKTVQGNEGTKQGPQPTYAGIQVEKEGGRACSLVGRQHVMVCAEDTRGQTLHVEG